MGSIPALDFPKFIETLFENDIVLQPIGLKMATDRPTPPRMLIYTVGGDAGQPLNGPSSVEECYISIAVLSTISRDDAFSLASRLNRNIENNCPRGGKIIDSIEAGTTTHFSPPQRDGRMVTKIRTYSQEQWYTATLSYIASGKDRGS